MAEPALVITGPTASGKSALALAVARHLHGEIISMDSRQVYRGLDVGTAKASAAERTALPHWGLDLIDPGERYSAGQFARDAREWLHEIRARAHVPVVAGGTLFFLRALQRPLFDEPPLDATRRELLREQLNGLSDDALRSWAAAVRGESGSERALPRDRQRLARLIEVVTLTGHTLSEWHDRSVQAPSVPVITFVMTLPREQLYRRINMRVHEMLAQGFLAEVQGLVAQGYGPQHPGMNATGYAELYRHVAGEISLEEAVVLTQAASRRYARRQLTWLNTQVGSDVHVLDAEQSVEQLVGEVVSVLRKESA
ncbi:MAG: tRNA (adenosine(37)-N6)-dimethylallyltransferase MiaA [Longimicrobiales bacterium]